MEPALTWLDLTARDREKMRRVIDLFSEQGTIDEMGLGTIRDAISDVLFPGTSSIQTRLRYFLFVPWLYRRLEEKRTSSDQVEETARKAELDLISPLLDSGDTEGVIGAFARRTLTRLPSEIYWAGLVRWGIFQMPQSRGWYHAHFSELLRGRGVIGHADDPGVVWSKQPTWHVRLPSPPAGFPWQVDLTLTAEEADFLRGRIEERCAESLLAWLAREGSSVLAENFWEEPAAFHAGGALRDTVELARRFSLHAEGPPLLYNLLLAERRHAMQGSDTERIEEYRLALAEWSAREAVEQPFDPQTIWLFLMRKGGRLIEPQRRFVESWAQRVVDVGAEQIVDDAIARRLVEKRELQLKGNRARLANKGRLLDWSGRVGVGRMDFRWSRARQLLIDLHLALES
jgi:hypothetical protein